MPGRSHDPANTKHLYNVGPTSSTLVQHYTNVIQMFCVHWGGPVGEPLVSPRSHVHGSDSEIHSCQAVRCQLSRARTPPPPRKLRHHKLHSHTPFDSNTYYRPSPFYKLSRKSFSHHKCLANGPRDICLCYCTVHVLIIIATSNLKRRFLSLKHPPEVGGTLQMYYFIC